MRVENIGPKRLIKSDKPITLVDSEGNEHLLGKRIVLCACGLSKNTLGLCDGSHNKD